MYKKEILKNGLRVITSNMPHMESISIGAWVGVGGRYEDKRLCGVSHLIEHMLFKGTTSRPANVLKEAIEGVGGSFNAFTAEEETCYLVKLPSRYMELALEILSDMLLNPKLDPGELEKEKFVICEEIKMYMDEPRHYVFDILSGAMWPNHALGRPIAGYIDTVKNFKREDLTDFKERYYQPGNISIVACGKIERRNNCLRFIENIFSIVSTKRKFLYPKPVETIHKGRKVSLFHKDTNQTQLAFGFHSINRTHKLRYPLTLMNVILGGNMSSRLFERLREKKALCYDISSGVKKYKETGSFVIHAGVDNNKLLETSVEIVHELKSLKKDHVTADELYRAKENARGQFLLALEDTASRMLWLGDRIIAEGKAPSVKEVFRNIEKVSVQDIKEVSNIIFDKKNLNFATIGPATRGREDELRKVLTV